MNRTKLTVTVDDYPDSPDYTEAFAAWMAPHNGTSPEHLTAGQVASIGFVPPAVHDPARTTGEEWAEYVWNDLDGVTRTRLLDHLVECMADIFEALPDFAANAQWWVERQWAEHDEMIEDAWRARRRMVEA